MASLHISTFESHIPSELLIARTMQIHASISKLDSLRPSKQVNTLFTHLVNLCIPSHPPLTSLPYPQEAQLMSESLIELAGRAEGLLELEFAMFLSKIAHPLNNFNLFPYYENYVKLANLEYRILSEHGVAHPDKVAFMGSGSMPLIYLVMATQHMKTTLFDNLDADGDANDVACRVVESNPELEKRMKFKTKDIMEVREELAEYNCIVLAALVGLTKETKMKIIGHVRKYMKAGGVCW